MFLSDAEKYVPLGFILVQISDKMFDDHIVVESPGKLQEKADCAVSKSLIDSPNWRLARKSRRLV